MQASQRAYAALRSEIIEWHLPPGTVLSEVEQAQRLSMSRTPVREAFSRLRADGLAEPRTGRGVVVSPVSEQRVREMFELRQALDAEAAALAARRGQAPVFTALAEQLEAATAGLEQDDADRGAYYALVSRMDEEIDQAAGSTYLVQAQHSLRGHLARVRRLSKGNEARLLAAAAEHAGIARAIAAHDEQLARATTQVHLANSLAAVLAALQDTDLAAAAA